jgi:siroheme synthase-like protein
VEGRDCLVVGAGVVASRKARELLDHGALVTAVAPEACDELRGWAAEGELTWLERSFRPEDVLGRLVVVAASGVPSVDAAVARSGTEQGVLVNSVDDPANCSFFTTATVSRGSLIVAVSTGGAAPAVSAHVRRRLEEQLSESLGDLVDIVGDARDEIHRGGQSTMGADWGAIVAEVARRLEVGDIDGARVAARELVVVR